MAARRQSTVSPRVLIIGVNYSPEPTGIGPYTAGMAEGLARRGWDVSAITGFPHYPWWRIPEEHRALPRRVKWTPVKLTRVRHFVPRRHSMASRALHEITFGFRALFTPWHRPDVVVAVSPALLASRMVALKARLFGIPLVTWVQDIYTLGVQQASDGQATGLVAKVERSLANASAGVVVIHDRFRRMIKDDLGVTSPVEVVRNWSHVPDLHDQRSVDTRRSLGWDDDHIIVLHAGNMGAKQGLENVVNASRLAAASHSRVRFVLMGDGNTRDALEAMGANDNLMFIDPLPDAEFHAALASADILLVNERPGLTEMSVPSKLTTYFATALPVLAAVDETSTTHDEILAAGAGPCVPAGDPQALLDAAEALAADPEGARTMGGNGKAYRERLLTEGAAITAFAGILATLTATQPSEALTAENSTASAVA